MVNFNVFDYIIYDNCWWFDKINDSGLSITEWQLFSGFLPPLNENDWKIYFNLYKQIPEYKLQNFNMSLQEFKVIFWWEWAHRFLGRLIGLFFF